ncbi:MAG: NUDIX hydrolase [Planctomycetota bacterium]
MIKSTDETKSEIVVKSSKMIYKGKRINVFKDVIVQPNKETTIREIVSFADAAAVVPLTDKNEVILIEQFRYPTGGYIYEIPAGVIDGKEKPIRCAHREMEEEIGFVSKKLTFLGKIFTSPGVCTEKVYLFLAENLQDSTQQLEHGEDIKIKKISFNKAIQMIEKGKIIDAKTICALYLVREKLTKKC